MGDFEVDTSVRGGDGHYQATLSRDWEIWGPNGGYLAAIALRAVGREASVPWPASFHGHFLSVARFDTVEIEVAPVRLGRRSESFRVSLRQGDKPVFEGMVRTAGDGPGLPHASASMPEVADPETLYDFAELAEQKGLTDGPGFSFWENIEGRPTDPERVGDRETVRPPRLLEWFRFRPRATFDDPWVDAARYLVLVDTLSWPAAARAFPQSGFTAPSLDVTVWFHQAAKAEPWLLADHESPVGDGALLGTTGRVWSRGGKLLASGGSQLMCIPPREG